MFYFYIEDRMKYSKPIVYWSSKSLQKAIYLPVLAKITNSW